MLLPFTVISSLVTLLSAGSSDFILPECPFVDPVKDLERWAQLPVFPSKCNVTIEKPPEDDPEHEAYEKGVHRFLIGTQQGFTWNAKDTTLMHGPAIGSGQSENWNRWHIQSECG